MPSFLFCPSCDRRTLPGATCDHCGTVNPGRELEPERAEVVVPSHSFEVVPIEVGRFEPFVLDVPSLLGRDAAARRAWWSAFHLLGRRGVDVEEFAVFAFEGDERGELVTSGGLASAAAGGTVTAGA